LRLHTLIDDVLLLELLERDGLTANAFAALLTETEADEMSYLGFATRLAKYDVLIIVELSYLPMTRQTKDTFSS
jgi:DNA replication protein DnaC